MLAEIPIGFWAFWLAVGIVLYVAFVWTMIRLAARWNDRQPHESAPEAGRTTVADHQPERSGS